MPSARPDVAFVYDGNFSLPSARLEITVISKPCLRRDFEITSSSTKATYVTVVISNPCLRRGFEITMQLLREMQLLRSYI